MINAFDVVPTTAQSGDRLATDGDLAGHRDPHRRRHQRRRGRDGRALLGGRDPGDLHRPRDAHRLVAYRSTARACLVARIRELWAFTWGLMGSRSLRYVSENIDNVLVGRYFGTADLAFYALAYRLLKLPVRLIGALVNQVSCPRSRACRTTRRACGDGSSPRARRWRPAAIRSSCSASSSCPT